MIGYSFMTLQQVYDDVIGRLDTHRIAENVDFSTIRRYVNRAIREIVALTLPYKDWAYVQTLDVQHRTILPQRFIKHVRVLLSADGQSPYNEARFVAPREFYTTTDWSRGNQLNRASLERPVFTIWAAQDVGDTGSRLRILLSPNTEYQTGTAPTGYQYYTDNVRGKMECYLAPADLVNGGESLPVPYEYEEIIILLTLMRVYAKTAQPELLQQIQGTLALQRQAILQRYSEKKRTEKRELDSFVEPVIPLVSSPGQEGEASKDLL